MPKIACGKCYKVYDDLEQRVCECGGIIRPLRGSPQDIYWTGEKVKDGFIRFYNENGHYPSAHQVDRCSYLPAARSIQRTFGGLREFREKYNLGIRDYTKGEYRSKFVKELNDASKKLEAEFCEYLVDIFGEMFVHREKPISNVYKFRYDFYVYTKPNNFGIDIFMPNNTKNLMGCLNIKLNKIRLFNDTNIITYYVSLNEEIEQKEINKLIANKKTKIPQNIKVVSKKEFKTIINTSIKSGSFKIYEAKRSS